MAIDPTRPGHTPDPEPYWSLRQVAEAGLSNPFSGKETEAIDCLDNLLREAVAQQMVADVPLGAFLSGGIDSSTVVALMQAQSSRPVETFTIGFNEEGYNEAENGKAVARHLGTRHTELYVTPAEAMAVIPSLPSLYDEPFADPSQIPTFLVSRLARQSVTVSLSGDGGDELFAGYDRYLKLELLWGMISKIPRGARRSLGAALMAVPPQRWDGLFRFFRFVLMRKRGRPFTGNRIYHLANLIAHARNPYDLYLRMIRYGDKDLPVLEACFTHKVLRPIELGHLRSHPFRDASRLADIPT